MKISGRNLKQRLYGLSRIPSNIKRARYWRGHGVHSPFVYGIVRQVFMKRSLADQKRDLYDALLGEGIAERRAVELQNLMTHCNYETFALDCVPTSADGCCMVIATKKTPASELAAMADEAKQSGSTLCIIAPVYDRERNAACKEIVEKHLCTSVDNRAYLLIFNNHLPKQRFKL